MLDSRILDWSARYIDKLYFSMIITRAFLCDYIGHLFLSIRVPHESLNNCLRHGAAQTIFKAIDTPRSHSETCPIHWAYRSLFYLPISFHYSLSGRLFGWLVRLDRLSYFGRLNRIMAFFPNPQDMPTTVGLVFTTLHWRSWFLFIISNKNSRIQVTLTSSPQPFRNC